MYWIYENYNLVLKTLPGHETYVYKAAVAFSSPDWIILK